MSRLNIIPETISYSALVNFEHCPRYYENINLKKIKVPKETPDTAYGTLVHRFTQGVLGGSYDAITASKQFAKIWNRFDKFYKLDKKYKHWSLIGEKIIFYINAFFKKEFGNFKVKHIEYEIKVSLPSFPQIYKGYIDLVLELDNGQIIIVDLKTATSSYSFNKYKDAIKEYQLTIYKKHYSEIEKIALDKITTYFIVFEKQLETKKPITIVKVGSGNIKVGNAENWVSTSLKSINAGRFIKNLSSCRKYGENHICPFYRTSNCK